MIQYEGILEILSNSCRLTEYLISFERIEEELYFNFSDIEKNQCAMIKVLK